MIEVRRFLNKFEADLAKAKLNSAGIGGVVFADNEGGMAPGLTFGTGARLLIHEADVEIALDVLREDMDK